MQVTWGEVSQLRYGKALKGYKDGNGSTRVFGTNGPIGYTGEGPLAQGPRPVVGRKGAYRGVHLADGPFWVIDTAYWLEPQEHLDPVFAYYALLRVDINGMDSGSALPSLSRDHFYGVPLDLPPLEEQERIAGVLGAFDDLIETNRRLADQLDEVRVARVSAALAESTFETRLTDIAAFVNGRNFTKGADGGGRPVIRTPEVRSGPGGNTVWNSVEADDDRIASPGLS
jgi:type I restriction enzyme S subunit